MSTGKVRRRTWGFTLTTAEGRIGKSGHLTEAEAQEALFLSGGRED